MYNRILIATDGSELGQKGLDHGLSLAKAVGAEAIVITVSEPLPVYTGGVGFDIAWTGAALPEYVEVQRKAADDMLASAQQAARRVGVPIETLHVPDAQVAEAIIAAAKDRDCALIVMASHGRRGLGRLMLGSKTSEVLTHTGIPVLVVR